MATRAALSATTLDEEVQRRLELMASKPSTSRCNGINHSKTTPATLNEGTEFPDQLINRLGPETVLKDLNKQSTSSIDIVAEGGSTSVDSSSKTKRTAAEKLLLDSERKNGKRKKFRSSRGQSNDNPSCSSSSERRSLRQLQEMALTSFCRDKWINGKYKIINVELNRDSKIGLGITVAGYVYKKEEISGVFIKSLVPQSSAHLSKQIQLHDLIVEVNGRSLEGLSHNDSVRALINSGNNVVMKLVRFDAETPQAKCLKMLHEQELAVAASVHSESAASSSTATGRAGRTASPLPEALCEHHKKHSLVDYKSFWSNKFGSEYDIIVVDLKPDDKIEIDGGIGIEWQGTVDVCNGNQLCSHHFISSLRRNGPAEKTGILKAGDELLQVNDISLYGESFVKMRKVLNRERRENSPFIRLIFCRKTELDFINFVIPSPEQCLPIAYPLLASMMAGEEHFIKAKSEIGLCHLNGKLNGKFTSTPRRSSAFIRRPQFKSRSLENLSGLAVWNCVPLVVPLLKDDPLHPGERVVLIIRSLVPGGAAQADGRIVPGDRLLFVNDKDLSNSSLENAVEVLKTAPVGQIVRLGIAKPVPIEKCRLSTSPLISESERFQAKSHSPRGRRRRRRESSSLQLLNTADQCFLSTGSSQEEIWIGQQQHNSLYNSQRCLNPQVFLKS
ncbi:unnamed protein product [Meloidogyne enterolobii]|uniref:Uncharacterized protein n=1 Tax=Meloidogyne enterolobii TaxID=390850 RepID=A0ACB0ZLP1_MELEN